MNKKERVKERMEMGWKEDWRGNGGKRGNGDMKKEGIMRTREGKGEKRR